MNGNHDTNSGKDASWPSGPGLVRNEFSGKVVEFLASITPAMFFFSGVRKG